MNKKALLLGNKYQSIEVAEQLIEEGYDLYAESTTALFLNQNMIPTSSFFNKGFFQFDYVVQV
ncbi:hypothetical protein [Massiliimalia massiliensis]|uniref:hypothetical protein n=1 Tax=Massiliimalia massiliensis TaxID=1852384 RepID=UPI0009861C0D|nr:hypothetical protein [Massiliimalia massiliensis]MBS1474164.1 hypothetical protein [Massiliimalia sp.]